MYFQSTWIRDSSKRNNRFWVLWNLFCSCLRVNPITPELTHGLQCNEVMKVSPPSTTTPPPLDLTTPPLVDFTTPSPVDLTTQSSFDLTSPPVHWTLGENTRWVKYHSDLWEKWFFNVFLLLQKYNCRDLL